MAATRKCLSTDDEFRQAVADSPSVRQVLGRIELVPAGGNCKTVHARIAKLGLDTSHFTGAAWNQGSVMRALVIKPRWLKFWSSIRLMPSRMGCVDVYLRSQAA
ncbi:MAG: hypothetical protein M3Y12_15110 [Bacteroidota bacterium]|nr:hypothetical protein [Bacteroidota bacterium]